MQYFCNTHDTEKASCALMLASPLNMHTCDKETIKELFLGLFFMSLMTKDKLAYLIIDMRIELCLHFSQRGLVIPLA